MAAYQRKLSTSNISSIEAASTSQSPVGKSRAAQPADAQPTALGWRLVPALGYLCTGTSLAVLGQVVYDQGAADPATQLIAWTKYACTFVLSLVVQLASKRSTGRGAAPLTEASSRKAMWLTLAVGLLDTVAYGLNCMGFALCGSSLSMVVFAASGQVFTALTRRLLLGKTMTGGQTLGVGLVAVGLVVRSAPTLHKTFVAQGAAGGAAGGGSAMDVAVAMVKSLSADRGMAAGVGLVVLSALGYSLLGCLYEWLSAVQGPAMSHAKVATTTSLIGLVATSAFQLAYTRPRWQEMVVQRMAARGLTWWPVVRLYGVFGALFTVHGLVQGVVLQRSGATAVGIVSACRASAVAVASGFMFCRPEAAQQCLTPATSTSAAIVTGGALLWSLTGPRKPGAASSTASVNATAGDEGHAEASFKHGKAS
ncbi:hypothetical protein HYH02_007863 [Chlamydomonas schloesseri]|uniref:EamA domain-containing protein n=1 Tax=Chlamydomonas schloesseri TaxID=2026947 RepID=A0A835WGK1_9CHLO|nr:hypothetical protein HYH02_007863 [Chlamydomonas schloesseri]|eukprot:KAG2447117.1 hypothetical protein HYH02_007863 [Chlamydomonas schloesseri]